MGGEVLSVWERFVVAKIFFFSRASQLLCSLCGAKRSHAFKFCERLKASNTMTRFGSRSSNSCYFTPKRHQKRSQKVWNQKFSCGGMPPHPWSRRASRAFLHFAKYSDQLHNRTPFFKILDPPLDRLLCLVKLLAHSQFSTVHCPWNWRFSPFPVGIGIQ